jgi:hypothetical protein
MKVYKCYRSFTAEDADVTIYVREWNVDYKRVIVEFFPKDPLAEPFKKTLCDNFVQGSDIAEEYIKGENFVKVEIGD